MDDHPVKPSTTPAGAGSRVEGQFPRPIPQRPRPALSFRAKDLTDGTLPIELTTTRATIAAAIS